ncbi:MAG: deoxyribose-phosphate aldolase [Propionicimonas sp.]|uniref:deoxyribose-phosphate aldolase n=1 Tax=Propionicimonas sp. TaxID=1955623 RepID=UPI002B21A7B0|nr:deoxyribose-phosphate aldolase [Propionicimonas sp.]MEA4943321.1 deoxyribose-phosphate aldolase [Propionicimonas sp.]MEA5054105.1 deoxyribose-phosphate aldolase [Propionicimonas sp.]MEA5118758.1 deoxyribose-phosphate aldolase [Propionicimonas sp.]
MTTYRGYDYQRYAGTIDHSLLRPELTQDEVREGCRIAAEYEVASVCARPADVALCVELLAGSTVAVGTVIGFPHGSHTTATKVFEATDARANGAVELDLVLNISWLRSGLLDRVQEDIAAVVAAADGAIVKVILENAYLTDEQKVAACHAVEAAGADYVKTSTGFAPSGATLADLRLMKASVSDRMKVKAAGGVRTLDALADVIDAGVSRCGATATAAILDDFRARAQ